MATEPLGDQGLRPLVLGAFRVRSGRLVRVLSHPLCPGALFPEGAGTWETQTPPGVGSPSPRGHSESMEGKCCPDSSLLSPPPRSALRGCSASISGCNYGFPPEAARAQLPATPLGAPVTPSRFPGHSSTRGCMQQGSPAKELLLKTGDGVLFIKKVAGTARTHVCGYVNGKLGSLPRH